MSDRVIAIGDIHGYSAALSALLAACDPRPLDTVVTLGDYIDRGPDSRGVLDTLIDLPTRCRLVPILGNHDEMLLTILDGAPFLIDDWLSFGGDATLASYESSLVGDIPTEHVDFLRACRPWHETDTHFFVHGSYLADVPLGKQPPEVLRWEALRDRVPGPHCSKKIAVVGHTAQGSGEILDLGYLKCIDTCIYGGGWLTAIDLSNGQVWQADQHGRLRTV